MGVYLKAIVIVLVLLFVTTFGVKNNEPVRLYYYFNVETFELPLFAMLYVCITIGIFIGMMVGISRRLNLGKTVRNLKREHRELQEKIREQPTQEGPLLAPQVEKAQTG